MKVAYFDCSAGTAGDMITAAMLSAGLDEQYLRKNLQSLALAGLQLRIEKALRCGISAVKFTPEAPPQHAHRNLDDIAKIIDKSTIAPEAKAIAVKIFTRLAQAEASVHGTSVDKVHFHEVGAIDSIADIVAAAVGYHALGIEKLYCSPVSLGGGSVKTAHGILPVPAPATAYLVRNMPVTGGPVDKELLTPTGAAILSSLVSQFGPMPAMSVTHLGHGAGTLDLPNMPNITRLFIGQAKAQQATDQVMVLETDIDDASGEILGHVCQLLRQSGALDVSTTALMMKNNRPGVRLTILAQPSQVQTLEAIIFGQGLTFGIRKYPAERTILDRRFDKVQTPFGEITIKTGTFQGTDCTFKCEFADCAAAAKKHNVSIKTVINAAGQVYLEKRR